MNCLRYVCCTWQHFSILGKDRNADFLSISISPPFSASVSPSGDMEDALYFFCSQRPLQPPPSPLPPPLLFALHSHFILSFKSFLQRCRSRWRKHCICRCRRRWWRRRRRHFKCHDRLMITKTGLPDADCLEDRTLLNFSCLSLHSDKCNPFTIGVGYKKRNSIITKYYFSYSKLVSATLT